jgi:hypothetical protein
MTVTAKTVTVTRILGMSIVFARENYYFAVFIVSDREDFDTPIGLLLYGVRICSFLPI